MIPGFAAGFAVTPTTSSTSSFSNLYSVRYAGTTTADSGKTNFGQPAAWNISLTNSEMTVTLRFRRNGRDGTLFGTRSTAGSHTWIAVSGGQIQSIFGGNFANGGTVSDATWYSLSHTVRSEPAYTGRTFLGASGTSILNTVAGGDMVGVDWLANIRRGSNNTDFAFGSWGTFNIDEIAIWSTGFTGTDHLEYDNGGVAFDLTTHSKAAFLVSWFRCGDAPSDAGAVMEDVIGGNDGTNINTSNVSYTTVVSP
jgi:hypothetical protein